MSETEEKRIQHAARAGRDEIELLVHDPSPRVLKSLLANLNMTEQDVLMIANKKDIRPEVLQAIAGDKRWSDSYPIRLCLARNPRTPLSVSLSIARFLRLFDLEEITRSHFIPLVFRHKVEVILLERIPTMAPGIKKTLAKRAAGKVLLKLLHERISEVVRLCLDNPHMVEGHLYKVISRPDTRLETILMIADHPVWSNRALVRFALARNPITPLSVSVRFIKTMKLVDLRDLYNDPTLPVAVKPLVHRALLSRGIDPEQAGAERVFEVADEDVENPEKLLPEELLDETDGSEDEGETGEG